MELLAGSWVSSMDWSFQTVELERRMALGASQELLKWILPIPLLWFLWLNWAPLGWDCSPSRWWQLSERRAAMAIFLSVADDFSFSPLEYVQTALWRSPEPALMSHNEQESRSVKEGREAGSWAGRTWAAATQYWDLCTLTHTYRDSSPEDTDSPPGPLTGQGAQWLALPGNSQTCREL